MRGGGAGTPETGRADCAGPAGGRDARGPGELRDDCERARGAACAVPAARGVQGDCGPGAGVGGAVFGPEKRVLKVHFAAF